MSSFSFDLSQQQQIVYASLMRFGSETLSLRNRCLDHLVMNCLLSASSESPFKIGELHKRIHLGTGTPILRLEGLREALIRLEGDGQIASIVLKKKKNYFLTSSGQEFMNSAIISAENLYKPVITRLLKHTDHLVDVSVGARICTDFLCEAFARCGLGIAKELQGRTTFPHVSDLSAAFDAAVGSVPLPEEARATLEARCLALFRSSDLDDKRLIFFLTQGYYFAQLIGLDREQFDPIAEQAFAGAVFYLDTNVLLPGLLPGDGGRAFTEMVRVAKRVGITLRITRASLNEARRVAADRLSELKRIQDKVPPELAEQSLDDFVVRFYEQRKALPELTPEEYLKNFERLSETVTQWGVEIEDLIEDEMLKNRSYADLGDRIQQLAARYRKGRTKSESVLRHDLAHYALVQDLRQTHTKTWFLTRDRSLIGSANDICGTGSPFCFALIGFLQTISPYIMSDIEGNSLSTVFAELLKEQIITTDRLFDSRELVLLAEMHSDVLSTPAENLLPAVDFVKSSVLRGKAYRAEDFPIVSLELRKFLACSSDEQKKALEGFNAKLKSEAEAEREIASQSRKERMEAETALLEKESDYEDQGEKLQSVENENAELRETVRKQQNRARLFGALGGLLVGALLWVFRTSASAAIQDKIGQRTVVEVMLQSLAGFIFCFPALRFLRKSDWRPEIRIGLGTSLLFVTIWITKMVSPSIAADVASYLAIAAALAGVLVFSEWKSKT
jgi:hypothetical protein